MTRSFIALALRICVLLLCAFLLWSAVDWGEAVALLGAADLGWLTLAILLLTFQTGLSAQRWRITAARLGISLRPGAALAEYYLSLVINLSLPGGILGDAGRAVRTRDQAGLMASGQAVVFERLAGQLGLVALLSLGVALAFAFPGLQDWPDWFLTPLAWAFGAFLVAMTIILLALRLYAPLTLVTRDFRRAVADPAVLRQQIALSLGTASCNIAAFASCSAAIGVPMSVISAITLIPIILFAMLLPVSIAGWGLREGAAVVLFTVIGASAGEGLAASVAFGLVLTISVLPGFVLARSRRNGADPAL